MILNGKYNTALIYTDMVDGGTQSQIIALCNQEFLKDSKIRVMPDCHMGKGCTVGTTLTISDKVVPNLVGVDIGCGVAAIKVEENLNLDKLDDIIRKNIPHGFNIHKKSREKLLLKKFKLDLGELKCLGKIDLDRAFKSVGTLGGGNHFIEIDKNSKEEFFLIVHTGSRNLGKQIAEYYQKLAIRQCEGMKLQKDLCYLEGELLDNYLHDMEIAQRFAEINRVMILSDVISLYQNKEILDKTIDYVLKNRIECIHNYIDMESKILRKGAISAREGETVLIPINMRDGILIGKGKGNPDWNFSAPHGAGRVLSRGQAKNNLNIEEYRDSMKDIYTTCVSMGTLDEAPQAYKPIDIIMENIGETIEVEEVIKPIYNFKSN